MPPDVIKMGQGRGDGIDLVIEIRMSLADCYRVGVPRIETFSRRLRKVVVETERQWRRLA